MKKIFFLVALIIFGAATARTQVTIGSLDNPHEFSVLELISAQKRGMRLPQMTAEERDAMIAAVAPAVKTTEALGLQIFNTTTRCVNTWAGQVWIEECTLPCGDTYCDAVLYPLDATKTVEVPTIDGSTLTFLTYNLGACPELTVKEQMAYKSPFTSSPYKSQDATVWGGLFQWGRIDFNHATRCAYGPSSAPSYFLYGGLNCYYNEEEYRQAIASGNPKIASAEGTTWIYLPDGMSDDWEDWAWPDAKWAFWGNGLGLDGQTNTSYTGAQNRYNPCPTGFRVPTQHEWASIGISDGISDDYYDDWWQVNETSADPANPGNPYNSDILATNIYTVWISVVDGKPSYDWDVPDPLHSGLYGQVDNPKMCGYAIYKTADWTAAIGPSGYFDGVDWTTTDKRLYDADAPEPLMFLSAAGLRSGGTGAVCNTGYAGTYWTSTLSDDDYHAFTMQMYGNYQGYDQAYVSAYAKESNSGYEGGNCVSSGRSVRCVAE
jgi:hypothetical protein